MLSYELIVVILAAIGNILLGLFTYYKNPKSATNQLLLLFALSLAVYLPSNFFISHQTTDTAAFFWVRIVMTTALFINLFFFLFASTYPAYRLQISPKLLWIAILVTGALIPITMTHLLFSRVEVTPTNVNSVPGVGMPLFLLHTVVGLGAGLYYLVKKFRKAIGREKQQLRYLLFGALFMFSAILVTNVLLVVIFNNSSLINLLPLYTLIFIGSVSYAIIKHRLLDINYLVARTVSFAVLTVLLAVAYSMTLFNIPSYLPSQFQIPAYVVIAIVLAYTFSPLRAFVERISDKVFHRNPYDAAVFLEDLGNILRSTLDINRLTKLVLKQLTEALRLQYAAFILEDETHQIKTYTIGTAPTLSFTANTLHNIITSSDYEVILFDELEESPLKMLFRQYEIGAVLPLTVKSVHHGIVILGYKSSGDVFNNQDINVLNILLPQLSIAIQNAKSFDEISKFNVKLREEIDRATSDLKKANRNLKHLDKLKDEFVFIATHELKNPVTAMRGYISMFQEGIFGSIPDKMKEPMTQLQASNQQLVELVNDLLQIARTEAKTLTIHTEPVELFPLIDAIKASVKPLADQKSITIDYQHPASLPQVQADSQRVKEIINNLLSNAIKYSDKGTIRVSHELQPHFVITHVSDQGVGISVEDQRKLFTRFYRVEEEAAKGIPGTGLGLFIVKQLIEKMGGEIWLNSEKGIGSTFSFSLPVA